jgi:hypothetical protein
MGVSETPVREAVMHLVRERALTLQTNRSLTVRRLSASHYLELRQIRLELEGLAAARSAAGGGPARIFPGARAGPWMACPDRQAARTSGGRQPAQGRASSSTEPSRSRSSSAPQRPISCTLVGSPASSKPLGTVSAGWPVRLNG